jgi:Carboxypeptidase regulatory-like domain/TonB dependent receptor-like, beta-barrel
VQTFRSTTLVICFSVAFLAALTCGVANAQVLYGSLTGNVTDPSNAAVPGAKVEALNVGTGVAKQTTTDDRGSYLFNNLQFGVYKITITAPAFRTVIENEIQVNANEVRRVDLHLQIVQSTETIEVSAAVAALQTDKADVHAEITSQEVEELPYNGGEGKNFQSLLYLIPGAGIPGAIEANSEAGNPQRAQTLFMNGVSSTGNSTKIDGALVAYPWLPVNIAYVPPVESIQTVNVSTNAFDAEQGAAGGVAVNVLIKSGSNQFHGVMFERNQNNDMTAVNYFSHTSPLNKNVFNQFGFAIGGPIWIPKLYNGKNKLFFFMDYQGTRRVQYAASTNLTLPTAAERTGDFSGTNGTIYDPHTGNPDGTGRTPFDRNMIPSSQIDPASAIMAGLLPALTRNQQFNNYDAYGHTSYSRDNWDYKVNYNANDKSMIWGRYSVSPLDILAPLVLGKAGGDAFSGGNPGLAGGRVQTTAIGLTYTVSPSLLLDGSAGYTRQNIGANGDPEDGLFGLNVLKIPGTNGIGPNYYGIPSFQITNIANLGNASTGSPFLFRDNQYTTNFNLSKIKGAHSLRFGFEYDKFALNHFQPQGGTFGTARGTFGFDGTLTALKGGPNVNNPVNSWAQFLLGYPSHVGKITQFQNPNALRFSDWAFYARDQWQVSSKLTLNYGLRWEYYPIFSHDNYGAVRFDPATDNILIGGQGGVPWDTGASANKKNFAPRIGIAYRLGEKMVIRTGYGITVDPDNMRNQRNAFPSVVNQDFAALNTYQFVTSIPGVAQASLRTGIPPPNFPDISTGTIKPSTTPSLTTYLPSTGTVTFPKNMNRGYIESWNFFIQRAFSQSLNAEVGYVGTHAVHTMLAVNINGSAPGTGTAGRQLYPFITSDMNSYQPFGTLKYNALQSRIRWRIGASLIGASYTFSRAINTGDSGDSALFRAFPSSYVLNQGLAGFDRTHTFQFYSVYQLPFGKGHSFLNHGFLAQVVGGFQIGGTVSRFSGLPFTVNAPNSSLNAAGQTQTADQIKPDVAILGGHDGNTPYFDGSAFGPVTTARLGTSGRNILRGPGVFNTNINISRIFSIKERLKLQLLGEAFNATNTPSFANPGASYAAPTLNADGTVRSYNGYTVITNINSSFQARVIQVGATLRF